MWMGLVSRGFGEGRKREDSVAIGSNTCQLKMTSEVFASDLGGGRGKEVEGGIDTE